MKFTASEANDPKLASKIRQETKVTKDLAEVIEAVLAETTKEVAEAEVRNPKVGEVTSVEATEMTS